jgi:hypothetical protein
MIEKVAKDSKVAGSSLYALEEKLLHIDATTQQQRCMCAGLKKVHSKVLVFPCPLILWMIMIGVCPLICR